MHEGQADGRTDGLSRPTTRPAFAKVAQVIIKNEGLSGLTLFAVVISSL